MIVLLYIYLVHTIRSSLLEFVFPMEIVLWFIMLETSFFHHFSILIMFYMHKSET